MKVLLTTTLIIELRVLSSVVRHTQSSIVLRDTHMLPEPLPSEAEGEQEKEICNKLKCESRMCLECICSMPWQRILSAKHAPSGINYFGKFLEAITVDPPPTRRGMAGDRPTRRSQRYAPQLSEFGNVSERARKRCRGSNTGASGHERRTKNHPSEEAQRTVVTRSIEFTDLSHSSGGRRCGASDVLVQPTAGVKFRGTIRDHTATHYCIGKVKVFLLDFC